MPSCAAAQQDGGGDSHERTTLRSIFPVIQGNYREKRSKKPLAISYWPRKSCLISVWRANPCSTEQGIQQTCSGIVEIESVNCRHVVETLLGAQYSRQYLEVRNWKS